MKKTVTASLVLGIALSAMGGNHLTYPASSGNSIILNESLRGRFGEINMQRSPLRAPEKDNTLSMSWGYCEDPGNAFPYAFGLVKQAICMPAEIAADFAGAEVRSLTVGTPVDYYYFIMNQVMINPIPETTVWISESLEGEPVAMTTAEFGKQGLAWSTIEFDTPYVISGDKDLYFGYTYTIEGVTPETWANSTIWGMVTDFDTPYNENSNFLYSTLAGVTPDGMDPIFSDEPHWMDVSEFTMANACVRVDLYGDNLVTDIVDIQQFEMPRSVVTGKEFEVTAQIRNKGGNEISKVDLTLALDGQAPQTKEVEIIAGYDFGGNPVPGSLKYNEVAVVSANFVSTEDGNFDYVFSVSPAGVENKGDNYSVSNSLLSLTEGYHRNNVVEEGTGTWCGWCVLGIAGMKYMRENYADRGFIGIALHLDDPMEVMRPSYVYNFAYGNYPYFPSSYMNRNYWRETEPNPEYLESEFLRVEDIPAVVNVKATLSAASDEKKVKLSTTSEFCLNMDNADYGIAYTVIENNVGPYVQANYCSGAPYDYYGYENEPEQIVMTFNEVARNCSHPLPFDESLPANIVKGEQYQYSTEIDLFDVDNVEDYEVVVMVINRKTGLIENACLVEGPTTGIKNIVSESKEVPIAYAANGGIKYVGNNTASVYTVDGRLAGSLSYGESMPLQSGVYLVVDGNKSIKLIVK